MSRSVRVAVVGAGPAGVAVSRGLTRRGMTHVVLERGRIGGSWEAQRWDSFRLNTPRWANRALGSALAGPANSFATASAVVDALRRLARRLPVIEGIEVVGARQTGRRWRLDTTGGAFTADAVVFAGGFQNVPRVPAYADRLPDEVRQLHVADYRRPEALGGRVLVVGGGQSGMQVAEDLVDAGKHVFLATSRVGRMPRSHARRDAYEWLRDTGQLDLPRHRADPAMIAATAPQLSGAHGRTVSYQALAARGVTLLGRARGSNGAQLALGSDLGENVRFADDVSSSFRERWETRANPFAPARGAVAEADPADEPAPHLYDLRGPSSLDLRAAGISTVIWATGFGASTGWLPADALDSCHRPQLPGLYVVGAPWLSHRSSLNLYGITRDADDVVRALAGEPVRAAA